LWLSACGVGQPLAEVDLERQQRDGPVAGSGPLRDRVGDGEVDQLAGGVLVGEVSFGLQGLAELPVERFDGVRIRYERRLDAAAPTDHRGSRLECPGW
jgi:hypothetical protein